MSDGYITSKQLSGKEANTGVARTEAKSAHEKKENVLKLAKQMAEQMVKEEREKKESNIKKEKRKKEKKIKKKKKEPDTNVFFDWRSSNEGDWVVSDAVSYTHLTLPTNREV